MAEPRKEKGDTRVPPSLVRYELLHEDASGTRARRGRLHTPHGLVETPIFMPVGTVGSVKGVGPDDLLTLDAQIILGNTYHLMLRPGDDLVGEMGGLHRFVSWDRPMLTDSGGFQVFSLAEKRKITEEGAAFQSHLDGRHIMLSPERSIEIQETLGADIIMAFDECPPSTEDRAYLEKSLARTTRWLQRCVKAWSRERSSLFGIVQGGLNKDLRKSHAEEVCAVDLPGYALGGFSVGETPEAMHEGVAFSAPLLPRDKPRYLMGVGTPVDLVTCVEHGVDMFDCVLPTRCARNGLLFTSEGKLVIRNATFAKDERPPDLACSCYTCRTFSRAYLRHLFVAGEILAMRLNTLHNLHYFLTLMKEVRRAIAEDRYATFARDFREKARAQETERTRKR
jgi:queuine tRNA-ribosyltransferase